MERCRVCIWVVAAASKVEGIVTSVSLVDCAFAVVSLLIKSPVAVLPSTGTVTVVSLVSFVAAAEAVDTVDNAVVGAASNDSVDPVPTGRAKDKDLNGRPRPLNQGPVDAFKDKVDDQNNKKL
jgi:hypothetical protein